MRRYAMRADDNAPQLVERARDYGMFMYPVRDPFDWLVLWRGHWDLAEIKKPEKQGHKDEFTKKQVEVMAEIVRRGGRVLIWRTEHDVDRHAGALVGHA